MPLHEFSSEDVIALIPAAGFGTRLGDSVPGSKEVVDVAGKPALAHLLRRFGLAGIDQGIVILREGKWDVPKALMEHQAVGVALAYLIVDESPSELHSVATGLSFIGEKSVALGYPDVLFEPEIAYSALLERQAGTGADMVLGLFPSDIPERVDMVALDEKSRPLEVVIKQPDQGLVYSWSIAVWTPNFSQHLQDYVSETDGQTDHRHRRRREPSVGDVVQSALTRGLTVEAVVFEQGSYLDIGTPEDLAEARRSMSGEETHIASSALHAEPPIADTATYAPPTVSDMSLRAFQSAPSRKEQSLFEAESALTDPDVRRSRARLERLLHPDFSEVGSSGNVYDREAIIEMMTTETPGDVVIRDFTVEFLADDIALVNYRSIGTSGHEARRTSIWVDSGDRWQLRHHQGTRVSNSWGRIG